MEYLEDIYKTKQNNSKNFINKNSYNKKKDAKPLKTITKIQNILAKYNITAIQNWFSPFYNISNGFIYSNRILLNGLQQIGCNGKGTSIEYALASSLGEIIERIQSSFMLLKLVSYQGNEELYTTKTEMSVSKEEFCNTNNSFFNKYLLNLFKEVYPEHKFPKFYNTKELINYLEKEAYISPYNFILSEYYSYQDKKTILLPSRLIYNYFTGKNGFAAGNTKEEALVQALSEIFAKYCMSEVFFNNYGMPDIPIEEYSQYTDIINIIQSYKRIDIDIKIKDASLGKGFPVVACIATDIKTNRSIINFGSHPNLPIAIERCLTELHKGNLFSKFKEFKTISKFNNFYYNKYVIFGYISFVYNLVFNNLIIKNKPNWQYNNKIWQNNKLSNKKLLKKMLNFCENNGFDIYIKDLSFLKFPCFHIYIPKISNIKSNLIFKKNHLSFLYDDKYTIKILDNLKKDIEIDKIFYISSLLFNIQEFNYFYKPVELLYIIAIISGYKLKKYNELLEIADLIKEKEIEKKHNYQEFLCLLNPVLNAIQTKKFYIIENYLDILLDFCYKKANEFITNNQKAAENYNRGIFPNCEQENIYKEKIKLKNSFIEILKTRKENTIDNSYLNEFFKNL